MANNIIKLQDGQEIILDEWIHWDTYSTIEFAAGSKVTLDAFRYTVGQRVPQVGLAPRTASLVDTNMVAKGRVNNDEELVIWGVHYEIFALSDGSQNPAQTATPPYAALAPGVSTHNLRLLQQYGLVELFVGAKITKPQMRAQLAYLGQSIGPVAYGTVNPAGNINRTEATGGKVSSTNQWKLELPIRIEGDRMTHVKFSTPQALTNMNQDIRLRFHLDALKRRPFG